MCIEHVIILVQSFFYSTAGAGIRKLILIFFLGVVPTTLIAAFLIYYYKQHHLVPIRKAPSIPYVSQTFDRLKRSEFGVGDGNVSDSDGVVADTPSSSDKRKLITVQKLVSTTNPNLLSSCYDVSHINNNGNGIARY